ncbi:MAG: efflux RND transporter permease subunit [Gammaproteobacteria bacterium]|nr:efflux RND transporter permease subunit [Gammaproteobacteria bacterium]
MQLTDIFIRRPVFATVLSLIILLVGIRAFMALPTREYPQIAASVINISVSYPGASPQIMEGFVTTPIENALSGIDGIDYIKSASTTGSSSISVVFNLGFDINKAVTNVSNAVASVRYLLPKQIQDPVVSEKDPNAQPIIYIPFVSGSLSPEKITDYIIRAVQPQIATLPGVAQAVIFGERLYSMRIWLNPQLMASHGVTANDVSTALLNNNVQTAAGYIDSDLQEFDVTAQTDLKTPQQFNNLVIKNNNGNFVRLGAIGNAELGPESDRVAVNVNGKNAIVLAVIPQPTANPLEVSRAVNKVLPYIDRALPSGLSSILMWDTSRFIAASIKEVYQTIIEATVFVILVIFLFLGSFRNALIPIITIPLSVIGVCSIMLAMGYSINVLTLLAWVLAIGLVVDDAIVVVENIHRHIEEGLSPFDAAIKGAREIGFAVIAMTLTLAAVYAPIGFVSGLTGALFREFAFTLAGSVIISGFVALTLSPMMCSKLLSHSQKKGLPEKIDEIFNRFMNKYKIILRETLDRKGLVLIVAGIIYFSCYFLYSSIPAELAPAEDQGAILAAVMGPTNANLKYTEQQTQKIQGIYNHLPEQIGYGVINGYAGTPSVNSAFSFVVLKPWGERKRSSQQIIDSLFPQFWGIPGVKAFPFNLPPLPGSSGFTPVQFVLKTTGSYQDLNNAAHKLMSIVQKQNPMLLNIDSDLKMDTAQVDINLDRDKAAVLGIPMSEINSTLNLALAQPLLAQFNMGGRSYNIIPQIMPQFRTSPSQLGQLNVRTGSGQLIPLSNIASIDQTIETQTLSHFQQLRAATITASLAPGYTLGQALDYLESTTQKELPKNIQYDFEGQSRQLVQTYGTMEQTFIFAIIFIFLVLAAQFESFRDPLIVMMSVPLSSAGALIALHLLPHATLNIYTQIGLITLVGLISKHGILIVEFANQLQEEGHNKLTAIIQSASIRLRPVLMTTFAMILGAFPLALASGAGSAARTQLGWVIIGGMSFGTFFTLFVIPTMYMYLASKKSHG